MQLDHNSKTPTNPRNYKGKLFKPGRLLRQWLARWYVLETQQNQLLYYDSEDDTQLKGHIDLGEMRSAKVIPAPSSKLTLSLKDKSGVCIINHNFVMNCLSYVVHHFSPFPYEISHSDKGFVRNDVVTREISGCFSRKTRASLKTQMLVRFLEHLSLQAVSFLESCS